ncbi:protein FRG2-like-1 [Prionailurus iriomotensis]
MGQSPRQRRRIPGKVSPKGTAAFPDQESEGCSSWEGSGKRKAISSDSTCPPAAGASPAGERSVTPGKRKRTTPDSGQGSENEETAGAQRRRRGARGAGRGRRSRCRSPGDRPPPLRKRLVTAVRALSEAVRQDVAGAWEQRERSPLTWEQRSGLGRLWAPLCAALRTVYTMANQAAYVFPAESWLVPAPPPGPRAPAGGTGEARGSPARDTGPPLPGSGARPPAPRKAPALAQSCARSPRGETKALLPPTLRVPRVSDLGRSEQRHCKHRVRS